MWNASKNKPVRKNAVPSIRVARSGLWAPGLVNSSNAYLHEWIDPVYVIAYAGINIRKPPWTSRLRKDEASKTTKHPVTIFFADQGTTAVPETSTGIFAYHAHDFILINTEVLLHGNPYVGFKVQSCNSFRTLSLIHNVHTKLF